MLLQGGGRFGFTSRYKIDIGRKAPIEVSKLKLYKFDREGTRTKRKKESPETSSDIVPYEGTSTESNTANTEEDKHPSKPTSLEEAKKEVAEALKEIWKLPESERTRAIRRLILRWHPDKNRDCEDLANEVMKFLLNEVERLKKGGIPGYREPGKQDQDRPTNSSSRPRAESYWDGPDFSDFFHSTRRRARRERQRYEEWRHRSHQSTSSTEPPNRIEAGRWLRQAREDLNAAKYLYESRSPTFYTFSCFHCQQVVEKCLIAVLFAKGRIEKTDLQKHDLLSLAYRASREHESLRILPELVKGIHDYDTKTRYPEYHRYFSEESIPSDKFTEKDAETALSKAQDVLRLITNVLNE